jgi:phosphatidylinositol alpha-mannosyltransferase
MGAADGEAPVVATFPRAEPARLYDIAGPVVRWLARRISIRIAVSEAAADVARRRLGGAFDVVPNAVDVARFADAAPADLGPGRRLLFVGRLDERRVRIAAEAFARLAADRPDLRLVAAGDGPERSAAMRLHPDVRERIAFLGSVPNEDLPPIHAACEVFVAPNLGGESFGIVLVEAMAAGLPVVASAIPASPRSYATASTDSWSAARRTRTAAAMLGSWTTRRSRLGSAPRDATLARVLMGRSAAADRGGLCAGPPSAPRRTAG